MPASSVSNHTQTFPRTHSATHLHLHSAIAKALSNPAAAQFVRKLLASRHFQPTGFSKRLTGIEPRYRLDNDFRYRNGDSNISIYMNSNRSSSSSSNGSGSAMTFRGSKNAQSLDKAANQAIANLHMYFAAVRNDKDFVPFLPPFFFQCCHVVCLSRALGPFNQVMNLFNFFSVPYHTNPLVLSYSSGRGRRTLPRLRGPFTGKHKMRTNTGQRASVET